MGNTTPQRHGSLNADRKRDTLPRVLGLGSATAVVADSMIGSGIFSVPAVVMVDLGSPATAILCWIIGGLITLCGALTVAELASALPRTGGALAYLLEACGPLPAFLLGWTALTVMIGAGRDGHDFRTVSRGIRTVGTG